MMARLSVTLAFLFLYRYNLTQLKVIRKGYSLIAEDKKVISIEYTLTSDNGETIDSSIDDKPLSFILGSGFIISGLEKALAGKKIDENFKIRIPPEEAYGIRMDELTQVVPRSMFGGTDKIEVGMQFHAENEAGEMHVITVIENNGDKLTIDGNHTLAGMFLNFDVCIVEMRDATAEEIEHGHVHDANGNLH